MRGSRSMWTPRSIARGRRCVVVCRRSKKKPFNHRLDYEMAIYYTVLGAARDRLTTARHTVALSGRVHRREPHTRRTRLQLGGGASSATVGLAGFGFELTRTGTSKRSGHLGRYISGLTFGIDAGSLDVASGDLEVGCAAGVWCPQTVVDSDATYHLDVVGLGFASPSRVLGTRSAIGRLCSNSHGAPFFSVWNGCNDPDRGPECRCDVVPIQVEYS